MKALNHLLTDTKQLQNERETRPKPKKLNLMPSTAHTKAHNQHINQAKKSSAHGTQKAQITIKVVDFIAMAFIQITSMEMSVKAKATCILTLASKS